MKATLITLAVLLAVFLTGCTEQPASQVEKGQRQPQQEQKVQTSRDKQRDALMLPRSRR